MNTVIMVLSSPLILTDAQRLNLKKTHYNYSHTDTLALLYFNHVRTRTLSKWVGRWGCGGQANKQHSVKFSMPLGIAVLILFLIKVLKQLLLSVSMWNCTASWRLSTISIKRHQAKFQLKDLTETASNSKEEVIIIYIYYVIIWGRKKKKNKS